MSRSLFSGRQLCIATKHGKERVIAPLMEQLLGVECFVPEQFDTDLLGTFTGEVERKDAPIETARKKCRLAIEQTGCDLVLASEGSFGNHPTLFFAPADEEFIVLLDIRNNLEIVARYLTTETNFSGENVDSWDSLISFARKAQFPDHALIIKDISKDWNYIIKGIQSEEDLKSSFEECKRNYPSVYVETDMRAMNNPMRMNAIENATKELLRKIQSECPNCRAPGFDVVEHHSGLPCSNCSMPTRSTLRDIYRCEHCNFEQIKNFPRGKEQEDPMYCDFCNP